MLYKLCTKTMVYIKLANSCHRSSPLSAAADVDTHRGGREEGLVDSALNNNSTAFKQQMLAKTLFLFRNDDQFQLIRSLCLCKTYRRGIELTGGSGCLLPV